MIDVSGKSSTISIKILSDAKGMLLGVSQAETGLAKFGGVAAGIGAAVATGVAAAGVGLFTLGSSFDEQFDKIRVGTGKTGEQLAGLEGSFKNVAKSGPASFDEVGTAIADLNTRLGLSGKPLEELSKQFLDMSRITKTDLSSNIETMTRVFGDWNIEASRQPEVLDEIYRAAQASGIGLDKLSTSVVQFGAPLRNLGFGLEESLSLLANFERTGVNTETVFAGLKVGVGKLAKAGEDVPATFRRIVSEIAKVGPGSEATGLAIKLFGQRAGPDLADAIAGGKFALDGMLDSVVNGSDTISNAARDTADFAEKWATFKNRVLVGLEPLASRVFDALGKGMDRLGPVAAIVAEAFRGVLDKVRGFLAVVASGGAPGGAISTIVGAFGQLKQAGQKAIDVLGPIIGQIVGVFRNAFGGGSGEGGIGGLVSKAGALIGATMSLIATQVSTALSIVRALWSALGPTILAILSAALEQVKGVISGAMDVITGIFRTVRALLTGDWSGAWEGIKQIASGALRIVTSIIKGSMAMISAVMSAAWEGIKSAASAAWSWFSNAVSSALGRAKDAVSSGFGSMVSLAQGLPGRILGAIGNLGSLLYGAGARLIQGLIDGIMSKIGAVTGAIGAVAGKIKGFFPGSPVKEGPLTSWNNGGAGKRLAEQLATGLIAGRSLVQSASARLADAVVVPNGPSPDLGGVGATQRIADGVPIDSHALNTLVAAIAEAVKRGAYEGTAGGSAASSGRMSAHLSLMARQ